MSSASSPNERSPSQPPTSTRPTPAKPIKKPKKPDPADYPPLPPMLQLTGNTPIPPASEPLQYRAIGLILGKYVPSAEEFNQGRVVTDDGAEIDAVLLGRIVSLIENHLDLNKSHLWVVYPRTRKEDNKLHAQIMGVWDPQLVVKPLEHNSETEETSEPSPSAKLPSLENLGIPNTFFSVRGEVIYQSRETKEIFVKIRQAPKKKTDEEKYFKIRLVGDLPQKLVGNFWDFDALRVDNDLQIRSGQFVASLRTKPPRKGGGRPASEGGGSPKDSKKPIIKKTALDRDNREGPPRPKLDKPKPTQIERPLPQKLELPDRS